MVYDRQVDKQTDICECGVANEKNIFLVFDKIRLKVLKYSRMFEFVEIIVSTQVHTS